MSKRWVQRTRSALCAIALAGAAVTPIAAHAQMFGDPKGYHAISPTMALTMLFSSTTWAMGA